MACLVGGVFFLAHNTEGCRASPEILMPTIADTAVAVLLSIAFFVWGRSIISQLKSAAAVDIPDGGRCTLDCAAAALGRSRFAHVVLNRVSLPVYNLQDRATVIGADLLGHKIVQQAVHPQDRVSILFRREGQIVHLIRIVLQIE